MRSSFIVLILLIAACTTYDSAQIYHKDFHPGTHPLLRFSGFYTDTIGPRRETEELNDESIKPLYLYGNGSAYYCENYTAEYALANPSSLKGSWGNYLVKSDTLILERFQLNDNNYARIILKGIISKDKIRWVSRKQNRQDEQKVDYSVFFRQEKLKPDSTKNFTRTLAIYNK